MDAVFAADFNFSNNPRDTNPYFHIFGTTKRLLSFALKSDLLATDSTYNDRLIKWLDQGYPVILCGTVDKVKQFHHFGLLLTKTEQDRDFKFLFGTLKRLINQIYEDDYEPTKQLADAADSMANGQY